ncbi:hypothetical protein [Sphaerimonospora mesophila]|uniref:hypothetical protein n=1 Tax=Sphaerimonospora mesophila TaxID=37483 RepID=UPI00128EA5B8
MSDSPRIGAKLSCRSCGSEIVVVKSSQSAFTCCDQPMVSKAASATGAGHDAAR